MKTGAEKPLKQWYPPARIHGVTSQLTTTRKVFWKLMMQYPRCVLSSAVSFIHPQEQNVITCQQSEAMYTADREHSI
jgi:hypothetical protein